MSTKVRLFVLDVHKSASPSCCANISVLKKDTGVGDSLVVRGRERDKKGEGRVDRSIFVLILV